MPPELLSLTDGPNILLDKPIVLLGRHQECDIQLNSRKVSRRHCCIAQVSDYLVIRDLDSTNGIRINGVKAREGKLRPGDELTIGNFLYRVRWPGHPSEPLVPANGSHASRQSSARSVPIAPRIREGTEDQDELDSCEEPVALADPGIESPLPSIQKGVPVKAPSRGQEPPPPQEPSLILPEDIRLMPPSSESRRQPE